MINKKKITDLNAPVLLRSPSWHQTLDVDSSISHIGVYSSLLAKKKKRLQANISFILFTYLNQ